MARSAGPKGLGADSERVSGYLPVAHLPSISMVKRRSSMRVTPGRHKGKNRNEKRDLRGARVVAAAAVWWWWWWWLRRRACTKIWDDCDEEGNGSSCGSTDAALGTAGQPRCLAALLPKAADEWMGYALLNSWANNVHRDCELRYCPAKWFYDGVLAANGGSNTHDALEQTTCEHNGW